MSSTPSPLSSHTWHLLCDEVIGAILQHELLSNPKVSYASYRSKVTETQNIWLRVVIKPEFQSQYTPQQALQEAIQHASQTIMQLYPKILAQTQKTT